MFKPYMQTVLATLALGLVAPAVAADASFPTREVSYAGLDLTTPSGVAEFEARVSRAVRQVCQSTIGFSQQAQCRRETAAKAAMQVDRVVVAALQRRDVQLAAR